MGNEKLLQPFQIIYASLATNDLSGEEIRSLLDIARRNNASVKVGGMLVYHEDCFLQVLEGPRIAVEAIYKHLQTDPRHQNVKLLLKQEIEENEFNEWSMAYIDTDGQNGGLKGYVDYIEKLDGEAEGDTAARKVLRRFKAGSWRDIVRDDLAETG